MLKFKKVLNANIISLIIAVVFFLNNTVYGIGVLTESHLRVPIGEESTYRRLKEGVKTWGERKTPYEAFKFIGAKIALDVTRRNQNKRDVFTGTYTAIIDNKFRVEIPSKLLGKRPIREIVLTFLNRGFIRIFYKDEWLEAVTRQAPSGSFLLTMRYERIVFASADDRGLGTQNRVLIPQQLQEQGIFKTGSKVVLVGVGGFFEVWPADTYKKPAEISIPEAIEKDAVKKENLAEKQQGFIDSKGRLIVPKKHIEKFKPGTALFLQPTNDGVIRVFDQAKWIEAVNSEAPEEPLARMLYQRNMFGSVFPTVVKIHESGPKSDSLQFLIPEEVCNSIGFNRPGTVEFIDFGNYWEIRPVPAQQALSQKINLAYLISLLKELSKANYDNQYYIDLITNPEKLSQMAQDFKGKPQRVDTLINLQSSYGYQAGIELIANAIDAIIMENKILPTGRFGIGAYQCLAALEEDGDYVSWTTSKDGKFGLRIIVTKGENGQYFYQCQTLTQGVRKGTSVKVFKQKYPQDEQILLKQYIKEKLYLNYRCPIYVNGELINPIEDVFFINGGRLNYLTSSPVIININEHGYSVDDSGTGMDFKDAHTKLLIPHRGKDFPKAEQLTEQRMSEQVKIFYRPQKVVKNNEEVTSFLHIQVAGVIIESFKVKGCALPENLVIELPASADLTEDRQHIQLTSQNIRAIEAAIIKVIGRPIQNQAELINGIAQLLENLNKRDEHAARLLQYMANQMRAWKQEREKSSPNHFVYLPNRKDFFEIAIPESREAIYINNTILPFSPKGFPGAVMARSWQSASYSLWALPFNASSDKISFVLGNVIIVNKEHYDLHVANPAALDLEINPIVTGYEPKGFIPQPKGKLLPENEDTVVAMAITQKQKGTEEIGLPDAVKHELESLEIGPDIMGRLTAKLNRFFASPSPNIKIEDITNWLRRLNRFNRVFSSEANVLNMIINSSGIGLLPSKNYTRVKSTRKLKNPKLISPNSGVQLPDGNLAVISSAYNSITIINPDTGKTIKHFTIKELNTPRSITVINGNLAVVSFVDNSITIINPDTGKTIKHFKIKELKKITGLTAINGNLAVCSFDGNSITIIDPDSGKVINHFDNSKIKELKGPTGLTAINGNLAVCNVGDNSITIIDPDRGILINHFEIKELKEPKSLTAINGNLAVSNIDDNFITIIDPDTGRVVNHFEMKESTRGLTAINGNLAVVNIGDNSIIIIEFEDRKLEISIVSEEDAQLDERFQQSQRFLDANSIFFNQNPNCKINYLSNLFYLKAHLENISQEKLNLYLTFLDQNSLALLDPDTIDTLNEELSKLNIKDIQMFFSFLLDIDTVTIGRVSFNNLLERWLELFNYLNKPNMKEARKIFFGSIFSYRGFLVVDFDMGSVTNEFLKMAYLFLRGDIENILSFEDRVDIQGDLVYELKDVLLEAVNAVSDRFPIGALSELRSYKAFLDKVKDEVLLDIAGDIEKSIYGQDKSENLFIRENVQNARDAILTERMAINLVKVYYSAFPKDANIDGVKLESLIPQGVKDKFRSALIKRINIVNALITKRLEEDPQKLRKDVIVQLVEEYKSAHIEIRSYILKSTNQWIFSIEDPVGMDLATIIGPLLVLDESTKLGSLISEGILGLGFYTNLADTDTLRITTGTGNGLFYELIITHKDNIGWVIESFKELKGQYKGTRIERIKYFNQDKLPGLDAAFVNYSAYRYVSAIQDVDIYCNARRINEELNLLAEIKTLYGPIRFHGNNSKYQRLTRSLLYVEYPKSEEYFSLVPEHFLKLIRQRGFTIDLSHMIPLVRTRLTISQKEKYLPVIQKAVAVACLKAMVKLFYDEGQFPPGLSEDYFEDKNNQDEQGVFPGIEEDAVNINQHSLDKVDFERYLVKDTDDELTKEKKNRSLKYLLTLIEAEDKAGNVFSLRSIKKEFLQLIDDGVEYMAIVKERLHLEHASLEFIGYIEKSALNLIMFKKDSESNLTRYYQEKEITASKELKDFKVFCEILFRYIGLGNIKVGFYEKEESRLADFGDNTLIWNLYHAQRYVKELQEILKGDKNPMKIWDFFREILDAATHELTHFYDAGKASHESMEGLTGLFAWKQKELIRNFINSKKSWEDIMNELAKKRGFAKQSIIPKKPTVNTSL